MPVISLLRTGVTNFESLAISIVYRLTPRDDQLKVGFAVFTCWFSVGESKSIGAWPLAKKLASSNSLLVVTDEHDDASGRVIVYRKTIGQSRPRFMAGL